MKIEELWEKMSEAFEVGYEQGILDSAEHGHWTYDGKHWICTNCKKIAPCDRDGEYIFSPYCHNCGARICEVEE